MKNQFLSFLAIVILLASITSCKDYNITPTSFGIFSIEDDNTTIMNGVIGSNTPEDWDNLIAAFPNVNKIIMKDCPGSEDDEANLEASRKIRGKGVSIHLPPDAKIASGAVDMFLAGTTRTREPGSQIGVHSWSDGNKDATDFPEGHANHQPYMDYYKEMGFSEADSKAFYYFTINAASASDIHWMTDEEIELYKLLTP